MVKSNNTIKNFWIIFFAVTTALAIAAGVTVGLVLSDKVAQMRMSVIDDENTYKIGQENEYRQSLYLACDGMKNLDACLGKAAVSNSLSNQTQNLTQAIVHANEVNRCLSVLPFETGDKILSCRKFVNQTQDYATYLLGKICSKGDLTAQERTSLLNLDYVAGNLYDFLQAYAESDSGMFITNGNGQNNVGSLSDSLNQVDGNAFDYGKLDYDGPFSDTVERKTLNPAKRLNRKQLDAIANELFDGATYCSTVQNGGTLFVYEVENGRAYLSADGKVVEYEAFSQMDGNATEVSAKCVKCISAAEEFCRKLGYDVKGVWISRVSDNVTYVNCATVKDGVIVYPDLIKVALDANGKAVGFQARTYLLNHTDWDVSFGNVSEQTARQTLNKSLAVGKVNRALVEKDGQHYACYEFQCSIGARKYYVYVDSATGKEVQIFKVIADTEGYSVL